MICHLNRSERKEHIIFEIVVPNIVHFVSENIIMLTEKQKNILLHSTLIILADSHVLLSTTAICI